MKKYQFKALIRDVILMHPKGFYYQGKYVILVGSVITNDTIRRKELIEDVEIEIIQENET